MTQVLGLYLIKSLFSSLLTVVCHYKLDFTGNMVRMAILFLFVFYYSLALLNINSEGRNPKPRHCIEYSDNIETIFSQKYLLLGLEYGVPSTI